MKVLAPVLMASAIACSGSDGTAPKAPPSDISTMSVGQVRVLNPSDIPNGIDLPSGSYRDSTTSITSVEEWKSMAESMGVANMGGPAPVTGGR